MNPESIKIAIHTSAIGVHVSGGIACIVHVLNELKNLGHDVCCFVDENDTRSCWLTADFPIIHSSSILYESYDGILISPFTPTAKMVSNHRSAQDKFLWLHTNEAAFSWNGPEWQQNAILAYKLPLKLFCTSHYVRILMEQVYGRRVIGQLVPPGVDFTVFNTKGRSQCNGTGPNIGIFYRRDHIRGNDIAIRALQYAADLGAKFQTIVIPDGTRDRNQLAAYYRQMDLFLDCSRLAGSPTPPKEAMACGAVCISTPYGATDFILDGINGFIVPVNDVAATGDKILGYLDLPDNPRRQMHNLALQSMQLYSWKSIAIMLLLAIKEGLDRKDLLEFNI